MSMRQAQKLPQILSREEVERIIAATRTLRERLLLMATYGSGLRVSEAVALRPGDLDVERGVIRVEQGKGKKDRYTVLAERLVREVSQYYAVYGRPLSPVPIAHRSTHARAVHSSSRWIFRNAPSPPHFSTSASCQLPLDSDRKLHRTLTGGVSAQRFSPTGLSANPAATTLPSGATTASRRMTEKLSLVRHVESSVSAIGGALTKPKRRLTAQQRAEKRRRRQGYMTILVHGKQKRIRRPPTVEGSGVEEFVHNNADDMWYHCNEMWDEIDGDKDDT